MKNYNFVITFKNGQIEVVYAGDFNTALILAAAEQAKKGNNWQFIAQIVKIADGNEEIAIDNPRIRFEC